MTLTLLALLLGAADPPRVIVSRREATVIFPRDTATTLGWPASPKLQFSYAYDWAVANLGVGEPHSVGLRVVREANRARRFSSLAALVAAGRLEQCTPGMIARCSPTGWRARVEDGRVVLRVSDSATVDREFGMHPAYARVWRIVPEERGGFSSDSVRIEYVEPALPMPDSARVAAAARAALEYEASITSVTRYLAGAERWGQPLWIAVGDTADVGVEEMTCHYDACRVSNWPQLPGTWRVTDTTVATLLAPRIMPNVPNFFPGKRRVVGASPGTTTLEVAGLPGTATPTRTPPPSRVDRVVVVTPPLTGIRIAPRLTTIDSTRAVTLAITAIDRDGAVHEDAPGTIVVIYRGDTTRYGDSKITSWFSAPGAVTVIARFRALTDTLRFTVVRPPSP